MSGKWPGGIISKTAPTVVGPTDGEGGSASGIWTLDQAADYEKQGLWPKPPIPRELWLWGGNTYGQLGLSNTTNYSSPKQVGVLTTWSKVEAGSQSTFTVTASGTAWSWGSGSAGVLGQGNTTNYSSPVQIVPSVLRAIAHHPPGPSLLHVVRAPICTGEEKESVLP